MAEYIVIYWGNDNCNPDVLGVYSSKTVAINAIIQSIRLELQELMDDDTDIFTDLMYEQQQLGRPNLPSEFNMDSFIAYIEGYATDYFVYDPYHEQTILCMGWKYLIRPRPRPDH